MRKQYYFRPSDRGFAAWDVDRLVRLSREFPRIQLPLRLIRELDEPFWFGSGSDAATCRAIVEHARLIDAADLSFPIILSVDGRVMDGMHRVAKAALLGHETIAAVQIASDLKPDFVDVQPEDLPYEILLRKHLQLPNQAMDRPMDRSAFTFEDGFHTPTSSDRALVRRRSSCFR